MEFEYQNRTQNSVKVERIYTSCGCTTAYLQKETLLPNEKTTYVIKIRTQGRNGPQKIESSIVFENGNVERHIVHFVLLPKLVVDLPVSHLNFGTHLINSRIEKKFQVHIHTKDIKQIPIELTIHNPSDKLQISGGTLSSQQELLGGIWKATYEFHASLKSNELGSVFVDLKISNPKEPTNLVSVNVVGNISGRITITPNEFDVKLNPVTKRATIRVIVKSVDQSPVGTINRIDEQDGIAYSVETISLTTAALSIHLTKPMTSRILRFET